ncbi:hypothetical protein, partial [Caulobacter sp. S45]|uniref:hypothetical protein n=1 Tax=Caulobacter sp. S45 TaxID=1641861 RepID=UPI001C202013
MERDSLARPKSSPFLAAASWRNGASDVGLGTDDEGTMHTSEALVAARGVTRSIDAYGGKPDEQQPWSVTAKWFFHKGRPFVARYGDWGDGYPEYVGALTDDLSERPLCRLVTQVNVELSPVRPADADICRVIWNSGGETMKPTPFGAMGEVPGRDVPGGITVIDGSVVVDAMNDGHPVRMYLYGASSGAGPGCDLSYYDTAPNDPSSTVHKAWNAAQGLDVTDAYARRTCA